MKQDLYVLPENDPLKMNLNGNRGESECYVFAMALKGAQEQQK